MDFQMNSQMIMAISLASAAVIHAFTGAWMMQVCSIRENRNVGLDKLGKGEKKVGKAEIPCRIVERRQGKERVTWYLRDSDLMPVEAAGLEIHPEEDRRK